MYKNLHCSIGLINSDILGIFKFRWSNFVQKFGPFKKTRHCLNKKSSMANLRKTLGTSLLRNLCGKEYSSKKVPDSGPELSGILDFLARLPDFQNFRVWLRSSGRVLEPKNSTENWRPMIPVWRWVRTMISILEDIFVKT